MKTKRSLFLLGRPRILVAVMLLCAGGLLSVATSTSHPRYRIPTHVFIDYCAATGYQTEVQLVNDTNRPVTAAFFGPTSRTRVVAPGSSVQVRLTPGRYAFALDGQPRVRDRKWLTLHPSRRYNYFHR